MEKWAKSAKCRIVREFVEEGISGASELSDRPALTDLFSAILQSEVRVSFKELEMARLERFFMLWAG